MGVVTDTVPEAPVPTVAVMVVELFTVNEVASTPPNFTEVAPVKLNPDKVTVLPLPELVGENELITGEATQVNPLLLAVPPPVVTLTLPEEPPATVAVIEVELFTEYEVAAVPPKLTAVAPLKLVPVMVTVVPLPPVVGVNEVMVGGGIINVAAKVVAADNV